MQVDGEDVRRDSRSQESPRQVPLATARQDCPRAKSRDRSLQENRGIYPKIINFEPADAILSSATFSRAAGFVEQQENVHFGRGLLRDNMMELFARSYI